VSENHHSGQQPPTNTPLALRNVSYLVKDGEVIIVDEFTPAAQCRAAAGRTGCTGPWGPPSVEAREGLQIQNENITLASVSYQASFRAFPRLAGGSGSGSGVMGSW
jgi:preprotein translocase subunit SecA